MSFEQGPRIVKVPALQSERIRIPVDPQEPLSLPIAGMPADVSAQELAQEVLQQAQQEAEALRARVQKNAEELLWQARQEVEALRQQAQAEVQKIQQEAWQAGFQAGEQAGHAALQTLIGQWQTLLQAAQAERTRLLEQAESEVVQLTLAMARRILRLEPILNEQVVIAVAKEALQRLGEPGEIKISVHPADMEILQLALSQMREVNLLLTLEPDEQVAPGGCVIQSRNGTLDATLDSQFERIAQSFLAVLLPEGDSHVANN